jgi:hypothetical protein
MLLALLMLPAGIASAQEPQTGTAAAVGTPDKTPQAQQERAADAAQHKPKGAAQGARPAQQNRKATRRRSVQQTIGPLPAPAPTASYGPTPGPAPTLTYGPALSSAPAAAYGPTPPAAPAAAYGPTLAAPAPTPAIPAPGAFPVAPAPAPLNSCIGNHCSDAAGNSYNMGVGNAGVNSQGRLCNRVGNTMHCF